MRWGSRAVWQQAPRRTSKQFLEILGEQCKVLCPELQETLHRTDVAKDPYNWAFWECDIQEGLWLKAQYVVNYFDLLFRLMLFKIIKLDSGRNVLF